MYMTLIKPSSFFEATLHYAHDNYSLRVNYKSISVVSRVEKVRATKTKKSGRSSPIPSSHDAMNNRISAFRAALAVTVRIGLPIYVRTLGVAVN